MLPLFVFIGLVTLVIFQQQLCSLWEKKIAGDKLILR